ncbi:MAG: TetR family transcriptional regulator [Actinoplanes sp.]
MGRWEPGADDRLREAAMRLYVERGFEQTTVAEIAQSAGVTARTFFRYFTDKREVLFAGSAEFQRRMVRAVETAPGATSPMRAVQTALDVAAELLGDDHAHARSRWGVIVANQELRERELIKMASLTAALAGALRGRGVPEPDASLAAEAGIAVFRVGFERWVAGPAEIGLAQTLAESFERLATVTATRALENGP